MNYIKLSSARYAGKSMTRESGILSFNNILNEIGYTGDGDRGSSRKFFFRDELPKKVAKIEIESNEMEVEQ